MPEALRMWQELSGERVREFLPYRDGYLVNGKFYVYQVGGDICQLKI